MSYDGLPALVGVVLQPRLHHDEAVAISILIGGLLHKNEDSGLLHLLLLEFLSFFDCFLHAGSTGVVVCRLLVVYRRGDICGHLNSCLAWSCTDFLLACQIFTHPPS